MATTTGPSSSSAQASLQGTLEAVVVAAAPRERGKRTLTFASAASTAADPRGAGGAAAATDGAPPAVATRRLKRGQRAADLATAGLDVSDPAPAQVRKQAAAIETFAASSPPRKSSRRLADHLVSTADVSGGPSTHTRSSVELAFHAIPNSQTCTLRSELSVPVATGWLVKDMHSMESRRIDTDIVGGSAITLLWLLSSDLRATQCGAPSKPQPMTWNGRSGIWRHNYSVRMTCPTAKTTRIKPTRPSPRLVYHCKDAIPQIQEGLRHLVH